MVCGVLFILCIAALLSRFYYGFFRSRSFFVRSFILVRHCVEYVSKCTYRFCVPFVRLFNFVFFFLLFPCSLSCKYCDLCFRVFFVLRAGGFFFLVVAFALFFGFVFPWWVDAALLACVSFWCLFVGCLCSFLFYYLF